MTIKTRFASITSSLLAVLAVLILPVSPAFAGDVTYYTYDEDRSGASNVGELTSLSNTAATIRLDYDVEGNVISKSWEIDGTTHTQTFVYAPHNELLRRTFSDGDIVPSASATYQYDPYGNLESIPGLVDNISRDADFDPIEIAFANGVTETRVYDQNRRWLNSITTSAASLDLFSESYTRDNKGLITNVVSNRVNGDWVYVYDTADRLGSAANVDNADFTQTFQYDAADNITHNSAIGSYSYPAPLDPRPHAVTQAGGQSYTYDSNGNLTSGGGRLVSYDGENRPSSVTFLGNTTAFVYGPDGKRLKKTFNGETTLYLGADEEIIPDDTHVKHPYANVRKVDTEINWMHRDHLSSVKLMTNASGAVIAENFFRPYGERSDTQIPPLGTPRESKGWIGERDDPETGLIYLNARYYDPVLARFLSPDWFDPADPGVGTNRFAYAMNNPIWLKDPTGNRVGGGGYDALNNPGGRIGVGGGGSSSNISTSRGGGWWSRTFGTRHSSRTVRNDNGIKVAQSASGTATGNDRGKPRTISPGLRHPIWEALRRFATDRSKTRGSPLYRGLSTYDMNNLRSSGAILPKNANGDLTMEEHALDSNLRGGSQHISLSRSADIASGFAMDTGVVVEFDSKTLEELGGLRYHDTTNYSDKARSLVEREQEVLNLGPIPGGAIVDYHAVETWGDVQY